MTWALFLSLLAAFACTSEPARPTRREAYAVGAITLELDDPSRETPAHGEAPAHAGRHLTTEVWYPAIGTPGSEVVTAADPERTTAPFGLVVFVHGSSGFRTQSAFLAKALAASGWVVAAADHPVTALSSTGGPSDVRADLQVGDVAFVATSLATMSADPEEFLGGLVATDGFAVAGHSTGGTVALAAGLGANGDGRVKAVVALAPDSCFFSEAFFSGRSTPLLLLQGTNDGLVPPATNGTRAVAHATGPKRLGTLVGGSHLFFTDYALADPEGTPTTLTDDLAKSFRASWGGGNACEPFPPVGTDPPMAFEEQHRLTVASTRAFLDATLGGDETGWARLDALAGPGFVLGR